MCVMYNTCFYGTIIRSYLPYAFIYTKWLLFRQSFPKLASLRKNAKRDRLGALHWRKAEHNDQEVRVRVGLDTGFMALDSIYAYMFYIHVTTMHLVRKMTHLNILKLQVSDGSSSEPVGTIIAL